MTYIPAHITRKKSEWHKITECNKVFYCRLPSDNFRLLPKGPSNKVTRVQTTKQIRQHFPACVKDCYHS